MKKPVGVIALLTLFSLGSAYAQEADCLQQVTIDQGQDVAEATDLAGNTAPPSPVSTMSGVEGLNEFGKWFLIGGLCTGLTTACGLVAANQYPSTTTVAIGIGVGAVGALAASLLSAKGRTTGETVFCYVLPVVLGDTIGIFLVPLAVIAVIIWAGLTGH